MADEGQPIESKDPAKEGLLADAQRLMGQARSEMLGLRAKFDATTDPVARGKISEAMKAVGSVLTQLGQGIKNPGSLDQSLLSSASDTLGVESGVAASDATSPDGSSNILSVATSTEFSNLRESTERLTREIDEHAFDKYWMGKVTDPNKRNEISDQLEAYERVSKEEAAKGTVEGDYKAALAKQHYLQIVGENGGDDSPEFRGKRAAYDKVVADAKARTLAAGHGADVARWDEEVTKEATAYMKLKGKSDAEIAQRLAQHKDNPLDAASDLYVSGDDATKKFFMDARKGMKDYLGVEFDSRAERDGKLTELSYHYTDDPAKKMQLLLTDALGAGATESTTDPGTAARRLAYKEVIEDAQAKMRSAGRGAELDQWKAEASRDVVDFMKAKGVSDKEIAQRMAENKDNPYFAAVGLYDPNDKATQAFIAEAKKDLKQYLGVDFDIPTNDQGKQVSFRYTDKPAEQITYLVADMSEVNAQSAKPIAAIATQSDIGAALRAAGVQNTDNGSVTTAVYHGVERTKLQGIDGQPVISA